MKLFSVLFSIILLSFLWDGCTSKKHQKDILDKELAQGEECFGYLVTLFNKGEMNQVSSAFADICSKKNPTPVMKLQGYNRVSRSFERLKRYDSALMYQDSVINTIEQLHLEKQFSEFYLDFLLSKSTALFNLHQPDKANEIFYKVKKEVENIDSPSIKYMVSEKLGLIAYKQKNYKEALDNFKKLTYLQDKTEPNNYYKKTEIVGNVGLCYFKLQLFDSAKIVYQQAAKILDNHAEKLAPYIGTRDGNQKTYNHSRGVLVGNIANMYIATKQYDSAIKYSKQSISLNSEQEGERLDAQIVATRLTDIYINLGKWKEADAMMQQVAKGLDSLPDASVRMDWNRQKATFLEKENRPDKAFEYFKTYTHIKDSLNKIELKDAENNIVKDLQIKNQESDLSLLKKDNELNRLYIWISVGFVIIVIAVALLIFTNYKKGKRKNEQLTQLNNEVTAQQQKTEIALQQLAVSNKEKDRILNVVAHDLRNPIGAIANFLDIVQIKYEHSEAEEKILQSSQQAAVHSLTLINELLEVNELNNGKLTLNKTQFDLLKLINTTVEQLQFKAKNKQQELAVHTFASNIFLTADVEKIQRVLTNLIDNAIKFSATHKTIDIAVQQSENEILIQVKDAGIGIPKDIKEQLFTASITVKRKGTNNEKSNGLGLSICKQIIEAHNGNIWVESEEGSGSSFFIKLPIESV